MLIAISEHARQTLLGRYRLEHERVRTIHLGLDHDRLTPGAAQREFFILYPANAWPHKNHPTLFEAYGLLQAERPGLRLVLTGSGHERLALPDGVESRGRVPDSELVDLYRRAAALVFPSLYEGFGLPPLEAMACGCPAAVSNATSLPEVCGDAAAFFDPHSPEEMAGAVGRVLDDPEPYVARGLARAALFSWDECAREHERVYRELGDR
jgi:glycosyltransferase involved in cell wall biosynthesis